MQSPHAARVAVLPVVVQPGAIWDCGEAVAIIITLILTSSSQDGIWTECQKLLGGDKVKSGVKDYVNRC